MNETELMNLIKNGKNPKELVHQYAKKINNPIVNNLIKQLDDGNNLEANKIINNLMQHNGMTEQFNKFIEMLGIK